MSKQATLKVTGMSCGGCAANVEKALRGVPGVSAVAVDLKGKQAKVDYDPVQADEMALKNAVKKAGYGIG